MIKSTQFSLTNIIIPAVMVVILSCSCALQHTDVTFEQAKTLIDSDAPLTVIDVREPNEYCDQKGHIPGSLNYPWRSGILQKEYKQLSTDNPILVVCRSGNRSGKSLAIFDKL